MDQRLAEDDEDAALDEPTEGGLQQQRHPGLPEEGVARLVDPDGADLFGAADDETDVAADKRAMDRLSNVARAHAINEGSRDDLLPNFW